MKTIISILLSLIAITTVSCSSDDAQPIYDDVLSNTIWMQTNTDDDGDAPESSTSADVSDIYFNFITNYLDYTVLSTEERNDTTWNQKELVHYYILEFKNKTCELKDMNLSKGTYSLQHNLVEKRFYPNQTVSRYYNPNVVIELTLNNDTAILKYPYTYIDDNNLVGHQIGEKKYPFSNMQEKVKMYYGTSSDYPYAKEDTKQYNTTFTRNGLNVELNGDIHLVGVLNAEGDEIEFNDIGKLQRTTVDDLPIITK